MTDEGGRENNRAGVGFAGEVPPQDVWSIVTADPSSRIVDVRTRAELAFVGAPDLPESSQFLFVEWARWPDMSRNARFVDEISEALGPSADGSVRDLFFLCRSGQRSLAAAHAVAESELGRSVRTHNILEGFEGALGPDGRRGSLGGWKARGLPWRQS